MDDGRSPEAVVEAYRRVFSTPEGRRVLGHMLVELHFFDEIIESPEEIALSNYARRLLRNTGIWKGINIPGIIDAFFELREKEQNQR